MRIALLLAFLASLAAGAPIRDGFEDRIVSDLWDLSHSAPGAARIQHAVVRDGRAAMEITVHGGASGEIREIPPLYADEGQTYEYAWSMCLPKDSPIGPDRLVLAQWAQARPRPGAPDANSIPVLAVQYADGTLQITLDRGPDPQRTLYEQAVDLRGRWLDLRFQLRFTPHDTGMISAWLDGKRVISYQGPTAPAQPEPSRYALQLGLLRGAMPGVTTLYLDNYRKRGMD